MMGILCALTDVTVQVTLQEEEVTLPEEEEKDDCDCDGI